jgi:hypothetical protein
LQFLGQREQVSGGFYFQFSEIHRVSRQEKGRNAGVIGDRWGSSVDDDQSQDRGENGGKALEPGRSRRDDAAITLPSPV